VSASPNQHLIPPTVLPDALVMIVTTRSCENCGSEHSVPEPYLYFRIGGSKRAISEWVEAFGGLPRELEQNIETTAFCGDCFLQAGAIARNQVRLRKMR